MLSVYADILCDLLCLFSPGYIQTVNKTLECIV